MTKRHQSSRRRSYGRRQHELHERAERQWASPERPEDVDEVIQIDLLRRVGTVLGTARLAFGGD